jgi:hypothetical protein
MNKSSMPLIPRILTTTALCLVAVSCVSCTQFCARFIDMGQVSSGIEITDPKEVYRVGDRHYICGEKAEFAYRHDWLWKELKNNGGEYTRIPGSETGSLYHEISPDSEYGEERYYLKRDAEWLAELPGPPSGKIITFSDKMPHGVYEKKTRTTAHALYAYPLAAAAFVAVDVPSALIYSAVNILMIPYILME